ncbi:54S ribosomal protein L4, mitochondrial [Leucoagaricus sp. SymC.cos]|nr:54S ribosomal protein L4, mitochondrial [Leucoagaricus sp. SymC.cos]
MSFFSLTQPLRQRTLQFKNCIRCSRRGFAEVVNVPSSSSEPVPHVLSSIKTVDWRKERVPVREDHGLYAFFRRKEVKDGDKLEGEAKYEVVETPQNMQTISGRGWKAEELRLKSFKDLHTLWYVLLRERNLLATQREETRRMGVQDKQFQVNATKVYHVRKSMARIKQVLNERRLAYEKAFDIASTQYEAYHNAQVLSRLRRQTVAPEVEPEPAPVPVMREPKIVVTPKLEVAEPVVEVRTLPKNRRELASETAAAGLFGPKF